MCNKASKSFALKFLKDLIIIILLKREEVPVVCTRLQIVSELNINESSISQNYSQTFIIYLVPNLLYVRIVLNDDGILDIAS